MIGQRIELARLSRGMSQRDLAAAISLSPMAISKMETGQLTPSVATMAAISGATGLSASFFDRSSLHFPPPLYRKRSAIGIKDLKRIEAIAEVQVEAMLCAWNAAGVNLPVRLKELPGADPEDAARATRRLMGLSLDEPVPHLVAALEQAGCIVLQLGIADERFDGSSTVLQDRPVIVLSRGREGVGDRQRLTAAHELAHTILHRQGATSIEEAERQADSFAGAFLMPRSSIIQDLRRTAITPIGLAPLKAKWRVSIQAIFMRAWQLGIANNAAKVRFFKEISARGWRKAEPVSIPLERPQVFRKAVEILIRRPRAGRLSETCGGVSKEEILEMTGFGPSQLSSA